MRVYVIAAYPTVRAGLRPRAGLVALGGPDAGSRRGEAGREALRLVAEAARAAEEQGLAFGALRRDATAEEIVAALGAVAGGLIALDRRLAGDLLTAPERVAAGAGVPAVPGEERVAVADET